MLDTRHSRSARPIPSRNLSVLHFKNSRSTKKGPAAKFAAQPCLPPLNQNLVRISSLPLLSGPNLQAFLALTLLDTPQIHLLTTRQTKTSAFGQQEEAAVRNLVADKRFFRFKHLSDSSPHHANESISKSGWRLGLSLLQLCSSRFQKSESNTHLA